MRTTAIFLLLTLNVYITFSQEKISKIPEIEGWYFRAISGYPASITFEPIVLFENGTYFRIDEEPIADIDFSESKKNNPNLWGTWKKANGKFILTNEKNKAKEYDLDKGNWFPAFPFDGSIFLKGKYEKISGGDFGSGLYALFKSEIVFLDEEHFTNSEDSGISSYSSNAWKSSKDSGTYRIDTNTIEFEYNGGKTIRLSFAIGAKGDNVIDTDMIFLGGKAYVIE
ncbi:MAG: hypothetical protein WBG90_04300 [Saonia sp.]